eukprot:TRINITY_DN1778_c0_g1_i1.p1 TRINITY_DN1778_c0_g1~~TRINITY_DN1778_c0_g1_i1.p1  ORF type:complete len:705 (+),score=190.14 TRINITY_DN1778_c0_g1_i1:844-2958(+)
MLGGRGQVREAAWHALLWNDNLRSTLAVQAVDVVKTMGKAERGEKEIGDTWEEEPKYEEKPEVGPKTTHGDPKREDSVKLGQNALLRVMKYVGSVALGLRKKRHAALRKQVEEMIRDGVIVAEMRSTEVGTIDYTQQVNIDHYSDEAMEKRNEIRRGPILRAIVGDWWKYYARKKKDLPMTKEEYIPFATDIYAMLLPESTMEHRMGLAESEWKEDSEQKGEINYDRFHDVMFEMADLWTDSVEQEEYLSFLTDLLECCKKKNGDRDGDKRIEENGEQDIEMEVQEVQDVDKCVSQPQRKEKGFVVDPWKGMRVRKELDYLVLPKVEPGLLKAFSRPDSDDDEYDDDLRRAERMDGHVRRKRIVDPVHVMRPHASLGSDFVLGKASSGDKFSLQTTEKKLPKRLRPYSATSRTLSPPSEKKTRSHAQPIHSGSPPATSGNVSTTSLSFGHGPVEVEPKFHRQHMLVEKVLLSRYIVDGFEYEDFGGGEKMDLRVEREEEKEGDGESDDDDNSLVDGADESTYPLQRIKRIAQVIRDYARTRHVSTTEELLEWWYAQVDAPHGSREKFDASILRNASRFDKLELSPESSQMMKKSLTCPHSKKSRRRPHAWWNGASPKEAVHTSYVKGSAGKPIPLKYKGFPQRGVIRKGNDVPDERSARSLGKKQTFSKRKAPSREKCAQMISESKVDWVGLAEKLKQVGNECD